MMGYDYEIVYRKGSSNVVANTLFRLPYLELNALFVCTSDLFDRIKQSWLHDSSLITLMHKIQKHSGTARKYTWHNGQRRRKGKVIVCADSQLRKELI